MSWFMKRWPVVCTSQSGNLEVMLCSSGVRWFVVVVLLLVVVVVVVMVVVVVINSVDATIQLTG